MPVESWLSSNGLNQLDLGSTSAEPSLSNEVSDRRSLLVVDTNSGDLQSLSSDLPDKTDLIVLDRSIDGIQQLKNSVDDAADLGIYYQSVAVVVSRDAANNIAFGNSQHGELSCLLTWCSLVLVIGHKMQVCGSNYSSLRNPPRKPLLQLRQKFLLTHPL